MGTRRMARGRSPEPWEKRLYLPAYSVVEAARLADTTSRTVSRWFYGYRTPSGRPGTRVLTGRERGVRLSYLQLVEVAFVATLRRLGVSLKRISTAREYLANAFRIDYPFAQLKLKTDGAHVLKALEDTEGPWVERLIVADRGGQLVWVEPIRDRIQEFDYDLGWALRWFPRGRDVPVVIDPRIAFGAPILGNTGMPTWAVKERYEAGESLEEIEQDFAVPAVVLRHALTFEGVALAA